MNERQDPWREIPWCDLPPLSMGTEERLVQLRKDMEVGKGRGVGRSAYLGGPLGLGLALAF